MEAVQETQQTPVIPVPAAPAVQSVETSAQPEKIVGAEGTETKAETEETPQKRESRRARQLNRERERRIAAETEAKLIRERLERYERQGQRTEAVADDEPKRDQFSSYEDYIEARATWRAEKSASEAARKVLEESRKSSEMERGKESIERAAKDWTAKMEKARDVLDDFDEVCAESEAPVTKTMSEAIFESDQGALIAYYLAKNPTESERISKLSPSKQAAAIVALEEKVAKPAKKPSKAPDPINPVGTKVEVSKDPAKMSQAEYNAWRNGGGR